MTETKQSEVLTAQECRLRQHQFLLRAAAHKITGVEPSMGCERRYVDKSEALMGFYKAELWVDSWNSGEEIPPGLEDAVQRVLDKDHGHPGTRAVVDGVRWTRPMPKAAGLRIQLNSHGTRASARLMQRIRALVASTEPEAKAQDTLSVDKL